MFTTQIFFLTHSGAIGAIPQDRFVRILRGEKLAQEYAGQKVRVADWYIKTASGRPAEVVNETYSFLIFDVYGHAILHSYEPEVRPIHRPRERQLSQEMDTDVSVQELSPKRHPWLPSASERAEMERLLPSTQR